MPLTQKRKTAAPLKGGRLSLVAPVEIQAKRASAGEPDVAATRTFRMVAYTGEPMNLPHWAHPVVIDMATLDLAAQRLPILYEHISSVEGVVGQSNAVRVKDGQVTASGVLFNTDAGRKVAALADAGFAWKASVGADTARVEFVRDGASAVVNGRTHAGPVYVARAARLREISFVVLGADPNTSSLVAQGQSDLPRATRRTRAIRSVPFRVWVNSLQFSFDRLTAFQNASLFREYLRIRAAIP